MFDQPAVQVALDRASVILAQQAVRAASSGDETATHVQQESDVETEYSFGRCVCECEAERSAVAVVEQRVSEIGQELWFWQCGSFLLLFVLSLVWYRGSRAQSRLRAEWKERARI